MQALEGVGESQEARSQVIAEVGPELASVGIASSEAQTGGFIEPDVHEEATRLVSQSNGLYLQDQFMSPPDSSVSLEYVHPNKGGTFQLTVEASQRLTAWSCASPSSMSKTNALTGTCPSKQILELGGSASTGVEETTDIPINEMTATAEAYRHFSPGAITVENEDKDMDTQSGLKRTKGDFYNLMTRDACANTQVALVNLTAGCQRDQQFHVVSKHAKHELSRTKNTYHTVNPDFPQRNTRGNL